MAKVMVVDDAAFMRHMLKHILVTGGHEVLCEAANGAEAVEKYKAFRPDLVTMDITMPEMEGIEALQLIRKSDPEAKVIMCSAMGQQRLIVQAIQSGASDFIVKPFQTSRVLEAVTKAMIPL
ncbi:response regulator [Paenibacillus ginsengarvi]|uniref:Response regulator n=1 Tax=Paenibacillus ginsengarvi TaxID=400777 RepID=A0A3B0CMC0_9BACL|nr:response regulator [Paenibacillus ginsengarvi]RKN85898.1 response regulator [Paenibacillus ginsengarvi]